MSFFVLITLLARCFSESMAVVSLSCPFADPYNGHKITDPFQVVYVPVEEEVHLPCCQRRKTAEQVWIIRHRFFMDSDEFVTKIPPDEIDGLRMTKNGTLIIQSAGPDNSYAYYCIRQKDKVKVDLNSFIYFIDVLNPDQKTEQGGVEAHRKYKNMYLNPIRKFIRHSEDQNLKFVQRETGLSLTIQLNWSPWSECDACAGEKSRFGRCRIAPYVANPAKKCGWVCRMYKYSMNLECASPWTFEEVFTTLAAKTASIPNFYNVVKCVSPCDSAKVPVKRRRTRFVYVGQSLTMTCPEYTREKSCFWRKDGIKLPVDDYEPGKKVSVNEFCTVFIAEATKAESGNFSCFVNDVRKQENKVIVQENYTEQDASWWRHFRYLWYIVLACFAVLIGGVAIGCVQRSNFKRIDADQVLRAYGEKRFEYEMLLPKE